MILERLEVHGFSRAFATSTAVLDFSPLAPGVYAWCGPNGAGKTTAMESIVAALYREFPSYGYPAARHVAPGVRDATIELVFRTSQATWRARVQCDPAFGGGRGKTEHYLDARLTGGVWKAIAGPNVRETDAQLVDLVPTRDLFLAGPYAAQRGEGSFFRLAKADKKRLFVEMLGHGQLQVLASRAADRAKIVGSNAQALAADVDQLRRLEEQHAELAAALEVERSGVQERTEASASLELEVAEARAVLEEKRNALTAIESTHASRAERRAEVEQYRDEYEQAARDAERGFVDAQKAHTAATGEPYDGPTWDEAHAASSVVTLELDERGSVYAAAAAALAQQEIDTADLERRQQDVFDKIGRAGAAAKLDGVDLAVDICRTCPLTARARAAEEEVEALEADFSNGAVGVATAQTELRRRRHEAKAAGLEVDAAKERLTAALAVEDRAYAAAQKQHNSGTLAQELERWRAELTRCRTERDGAAAKLADLVVTDTEREEVNRRSMAAGLANNALVDAQQRLRLLEDARREAERAAARIEGQLAAVEKQIGGRDLAGVEEQLAYVQQQRRSWSLLEVGLGANGVQALEIDAAGPEVSGLANALLVDCYGPRFQVRLETTRELKTKDGQAEVFECAVIDAEAGHTSHDGSGGEMVIVEEALRLALAIYSTQRSGRECLTLFRDEAAGALDQWPGRDSAARYLAMLRAARERGGFHQVHFIAHQPALFESADGRFVFDGAGGVQFEEG